MELARWSRTLVAVLLLSVPANVARAQLAWHAPARCPPPASAAELATSGSGRSGPRVLVQIQEQAAGWVATLTARYDNARAGARRLSAPSCAELQRAVTLALSLLDEVADEPRAAVAPVEAEAYTLSVPEQFAGAPAPQASGAAPVPAAASVRADPVLPAANPFESAVAVVSDAGATPFVHTLAQRPRLAGFARAGSLVALAGSHFAELGAGLGAGAWLGNWGARAEFEVRWPISGIPAAQNFSLQLQRFGGALELCRRQGSELVWGVCAGPRLQLVRGLAVGPSDPTVDVVWVPGVGAGAWLRAPLAARWGFVAELRGSYALRAVRANVEPWGTVYELPRFGSGLLAGVEWAP